LLGDSLNKQIIAFNTSDIEHDIKLTEVFERFEIPEDSNQPGPGEMMLECDYFRGTESVRVSINENNGSVLKLKHDMICYPIRNDTKRYERQRYILQLIGAFRNTCQEQDGMSKSL
jgi:hypothetical protein